MSKTDSVHKLSRLRNTLVLPLFALLAGCNAVVLNPSGDVALQQRDLLIHSTWLMLIIIIPVMALTILFAWRYRQSNQNARYEPDWHHSTRLELVIWSAPLLIIICLGALTWLGTHLLDPYRPLGRITKGQPVTEAHKPLEVNVIALDWKWLFIYPEYGIATINELAVPVERPVKMRITAEHVMNSLYVPEMAGMVYAMPGMETQLHGVLNKPVQSRGFSTNYSGAGFSGMKFALKGVTEGEFDAWIAEVRNSGDELTRAEYLELAKPTENDPVRHFSSAEADLYHAILNRCVVAGTPCMDQMMAGGHEHHAAAGEHAGHDQHAGHAATTAQE